MRTKQDDYFKGMSIAPGTEPALNRVSVIITKKLLCFTFWFKPYLSDL